MLLVPRARYAPSPRWLVRTGDTVIGPVPTELLVRGVGEGRVPRDCWVRAERSLEWRRLAQVRELSAPDATGAVTRAAAAFADARDEGETLSFLLHAAAQLSGSPIASLHKTRGGTVLVTSCVLGLPDRHLGRILPVDDPLLRLARSGDCVHGNPADGYLQRAIADRLSPDIELASVIMVPVLYGTELVALLELGRSDHGYRQGDADALQRLSAYAVDRLESLSL
jgi:hypothetical protein